MNTMKDLCKEAERRTQQWVGDTLILGINAEEIDALTARIVQQAILEAQRPRQSQIVVLDLRRVRLIDAAGWAMLIATHQQMVRDGRRLRILLARGSQPFRAFVTRWLHVTLDRIDDLDDLDHSTRE